VNEAETARAIVADNMETISRHARERDVASILVRNMARGGYPCTLFGVQRALARTAAELAPENSDDRARDRAGRGDPGS
jgi:hypothetical protein